MKIISLPLQEAASALPENTLATLELHPWNGETFSDKFVQLAQEKTFIGIGEAGLDRLRGKLPLSDQIEIFEQVVNLAETLQKPLTIHCVKCFSELLQLYKKLTWQVPTVIHYYRGNLELAQQLWRDTHFYLSLPPAVYTQKKLLEFLQNSPQYLKRIMLETDDPAGDIVKHFTLCQSCWLWNRRFSSR